jgi:hypothetical protein
VIFKGDSQVVVAALKTEHLSCCSYGHIVEDTRELFNKFHDLEIRHVRRLANQAARVMAKVALVYKFSYEWLGVCSQQILDVVAFKHDSF